MEILRRRLSVFLAIIMVLGMLPMPATASEMEIKLESVAEDSVPMETQPDAVVEATAAQIKEPTVMESTEAVEEITEPVEENVAVTAPAETIPETTVETESEETVFAMGAEDALPGGTCGENLTWTLDKNGVLTISGNGAMEDYSAETMPPWSDYADQIRCVDIKEGVTTISAYAFCYESITSVIIPEGLLEIGCYAFGTSGIIEITLPGSVTSVDMVAFSDCSNLSSFTVLDSADIDSEIVFAGINDLGYGVFSNCPNLKTVTLGNTVKAIPDRLFSPCSGLTNITFSDSLRSIGNYAFGGCSSLEEVVLPGSVTSVGMVAFSGCSNLSSFTVLDSADIDSEIVFAGINDLGYGVFSNCPNLKTVTLGNTVKVIPDRLFSMCSGLSNITFSDSLRIIGDYAFGYCTGLEEIVLPGSVTGVGMVAFADCGNLNSFTVLDSADINSEIVFAGVNDLGYGVFSGCPNLKTVTLGNTVKVIPDRLFSPCSGLTNITFSDSLRSIGNYAFGGCSSLEEVVLPGSVTSVGMVAFSGCSNLSSFTILDSADSNSEITFAGINELGSGVFSNCPNLKTVTLGNTVKTIPSELFSSHTGLCNITFSDSLRIICDYAFSGCTGLEKIVIPESVTLIGSDAFAYSGLSRIIFRGDAPEFGTVENGDGVFTGVTATAYYLADNETWTSDVMRNYGGEITWRPYSNSLEVYAENNLSYILSGKKLQLTAYQAADEQEISAIWEVTEGSAFATVHANGLVTAKTVGQTETIVVTATAQDTGEQATITLKILPKNTVLDILFEDEIVTEVLNADMYSTESITLSAKLNGEEIDASWVSSGSAIAAVEGGVVSLRKPGTVTITAKDVYGISGSVTLNVFYIDPAKKLTASVDAPSIGLQQGQTAQMTVSGEAELAENLLSFTSSNEAMATVDENGIITGGSKTGTVKITAAIKDDPLKRSAVVSVKIIAAETKTLSLDPSEVVLDKADLTTKESRIFTITPTAESEFGSMTLTGKSLKWTSSDTKLATVKANADGSATVTIAANKAGTATITAQSTDLAKVTATMNLMVYDKAPKLSATAVTLNPMMETGVDVELIPGYENAIEEVTIDNADLDVAYDAQSRNLNIKANKALKNGNLSTKLSVICADGKTYVLNLKVTIKGVTPAITIKQTAKLDLFYKDSEATLTVTAKDTEVEKLELTGTDDFTMDESMDESGVIRFADTLADKYAENIKYKPNTKATLLVYLEGYAHPVEKAITITTSATKLNLSTDPASSTVNINTKFGADLDVRFKLYNKTAKQILDLEGEDVVSVVGYDVDVAMDSDEVSLTLAEAKKATLNISVQKENWMYPVTLKHTVAVTDKDPTVKLGKTTLKLNTKLPEMTDSTSAVLTNGNLAITGFDNNDLFVTTAKAGTDAWRNAQMIRVEYVNAGNGGDIVASIEPGQMPKAGTYTYTATPDIDGEPLKSVTIKVSVSSAEPKVTLGAKDKLDTVNPESRIIYTVNSVTNADGNLEDVVFEQGEDWFQISRLHRDSKGKQYFTMRLRENVTYSTKQTYKVVFSYKICGEWFTSNTLNIKVSQSNLKITASAAQYVPGQENVNVNLTLTTPENARMEQVVINEAKTAKELIAALEESVLNENLLENAAAEAELTLPVADDSNLKPGRSYKLVLDITPVGHASDAKITTVTVNIKIAK